MSTSRALGRVQVICLASFPDLMARFNEAADAYSKFGAPAGPYYRERNACWVEAVDRTARMIRLLCCGAN